MMKLVVFTCLLAAASASGFAGYTPYTAAYTPYTAAYTPYAYSGFVAPYNYRGPLSLAPGQPANILGSDGRPLDTLEVNLDRSAHLAAKTIGGVHLLKKRSAPFIAPINQVAIAHTTPYVAPSHLAYSAHIAPQYNYGYPLAYSAAPFVHY